MNKNYLIIVVCLFVTYSCSDENVLSITEPIAEYDTKMKNVGNTVSEEKALNTAKLFFEKNSEFKLRSGKSRNIRGVETINDEKDNPLMYIVNFNKNEGFVIISAKKSHFPILAFSESNSFVLSNNLDPNEGLLSWIEETKNTINMSDSIDEKKTFITNNMWFEYEMNEGVSTNTPQLTRNIGDQSTAYHKRVNELQRKGQGYNFIHYLVSVVHC